MRSNPWGRGLQISLFLMPAWVNAGMTTLRKTANPSSNSKSSEDVMYRNVGLFIDGEWLSGDQEVIKPATEVALAHVSHAGQVDRSDALKAATRPFLDGAPSWRTSATKPV